MSTHDSENGPVMRDPESGRVLDPKPITVELDGQLGVGLECHVSNSQLLLDWLTETARRVSAQGIVDGSLSIEVLSPSTMSAERGWQSDKMKMVHTPTGELVVFAHWRWNDGKE